MNEKLKTLGKQANLPAWMMDDSTTVNVAEKIELFAELIIQECCDQVRYIDAVEIKNHFGVEK